MIPDFVDVGGAWGVLPPGVHDASLLEISRRFAYNATRLQLFDGFVLGVAALRRAGCRAIYLDGSFVTEKETPGDFDSCWDPVGVDATQLSSVFFDLAHPRQKQKAQYGGEFFPSSISADGKFTFLEFFQYDRDTGERKGIIRLRDL